MLNEYYFYKNTVKHLDDLIGKEGVELYKKVIINLLKRDRLSEFDIDVRIRKDYNFSIYPTDEILNMLMDDEKIGFDGEKYYLIDKIDERVDKIDKSKKVISLDSWIH